MPKGSRFIWDTSAPILPVWLRAMPEAIVGHAFLHLPGALSADAARASRGADYLLNAGQSFARNVRHAGHCGGAVWR